MGACEDFRLIIFDKIIFDRSFKILWILNFSWTIFNKKFKRKNSTIFVLFLTNFQINFENLIFSKILTKKFKKALWALKNFPQGHKKCVMLNIMKIFWFALRLYSHVAFFISYIKFYKNILGLVWSTHRAMVKRSERNISKYGIKQAISHSTLSIVKRSFEACLNSRAIFLRAWWILEFRAHFTILLYNVRRGALQVER